MTEQRDWQADWERCEQATPGRWEVEGAGGVYMNGTRDGYNVCVNGKRLNNPWFSYEDASFITTAYEALPYWLQRVRELEEDVTELEADVGSALVRLEKAEEKLKELEAENRRLKAVAEAAKWVRETWVNNWEREIVEVDYGPAKRLDDALRALAALEEANKDAGTER